MERARPSLISIKTFRRRRRSCTEFRRLCSLGMRIDPHAVGLLSQSDSTTRQACCGGETASLTAMEERFARLRSVSFRGRLARFRQRPRTSSRKKSYTFIRMRDLTWISNVEPSRLSEKTLIKGAPGTFEPVERAMRGASRRRRRHGACLVGAKSVVTAKQRRRDDEIHHVEGDGVQV